MWRYPALTGVSEKRIVSIFRVEKSAREEPALAGSSKTTVNAGSTQRHIPEDDILQLQ
jgi:hypothetical protein